MCQVYFFCALLAIYRMRGEILLNFALWDWPFSVSCQLVKFGWWTWRGGLWVVQPPTYGILLPGMLTWPHNCKLFIAALRHSYLGKFEIKTDYPSPPPPILTTTFSDVVFQEYYILMFGYFYVVWFLRLFSRCILYTISCFGVT